MTARRKQATVLKTLLVAAALAVFAGQSMALDHDGDGKFDLTVYRPVWSPYNWYLSSTALNGQLTYQWGLPGDLPAPGKYSGGAGADLAVWRPTDGVWYIRRFSTDLQFSQMDTYQWGLPGDTPQPCDYDGDGRTDLAVWRNTDGVWYVRLSGGSTPFASYTVQQWGLPGDRPLPADYDADGKCDYTVFRAGQWFVVLSTENNEIGSQIPWGSEGDVPVPGKYANSAGVSDAIPDFAVYREGTVSGPLWMIRLSNLGGLTSRVIQWGLPGDLPVPGDYTGDGVTDIAVFRPGTGVWYVRTSESNYASAAAYQFGLPGDVPIGDRAGQ